MQDVGRASKETGDPLALGDIHAVILGVLKGFVNLVAYSSSPANSPRRTLRIVSFALGLGSGRTVA